MKDVKQMSLKWAHFPSIAQYLSTSDFTVESKPPICTEKVIIESILDIQIHIDADTKRQSTELRNNNKKLLIKPWTGL